MLAILAGTLLYALPPAPPTIGVRQDPVLTPQRAAIESAIGELWNAARAGDRDAYLEAWDVERMLEEIVTLLGRDGGLLSEGSRFRSSFLSGLRTGLLGRTGDMAWESYDVLRVALAPGGQEATVLLRVRQPNETMGRMRLWLVRHEADWRVWDVEDVTGGLRATTLMVPILGPFVRSDSIGDLELPPWIEHALALVEGLRAMAGGDMEKVTGVLQATEGVELPQAFASVRVLLEVGMDVGQGRYADAIVHVEAAPAADLVVLDYLAAVAHNALGQSEEALVRARRFLERAGDDAEGRLEEGIALADLGREDEALAAFRAGLDEDPRSLELMVELGCALPLGEKAELGRRLVDSGDPAGSFEPVVVELLARDELESAEVLIAALREAVPGDPNADYYQAEMLSYEGRHAEAAALLADAIPRVDDPEERVAYEYAYLERMTDAGRPLEGYSGLEDADFAFEQLGTMLFQSGNGPALLELVRLHAERAPDHPGLALTRARGLALLERRAEAEEAFAQAMEHLEPDELDDVRRERVDNLFAAGEWRRAYAEVGPVTDTFEDLAWHFQESGDADGLEALVALHAEGGGDPDSAQLVRWTAEVAWLRGQPERVLELLLPEDPALREEVDPSALYVWEDRVVRCMLRLGRLDEATGLARRIDERDDDPFYAALVHAAAGRMEPASEALERLLDSGYWESWELYEDEDFGPLLTAEGASALRAIAPPPDPIEDR